MHRIRAIDLEQDYDTLCRWWQGHGAIVMPKHILPQGWIVSEGGVDVAASFLYLDVGGKLAVIEWLTTNPSVAFSRFLVEDVKKLVAHVEGVALAQGCAVMLSFVAPDTGEERLLKKLGYGTSEGPSHRIYARALTEAP